ncbi:Detected protein of unknown function [Hibiscus syriacus]|uniref:Uncharacterized protein n=1 Tax=Hibiscus syriacus TaxID=106335 RepID=A0A6A2XDW7_HIBSY|nr:uncharacterized protein LOC120197112 [Hibiscus syriacus]KAE8654787.1 Detected protein of unknown function [Hibiscus syriacus]
MDSIRAALFKRHSNYSISVNEIGMKLDFVWAPYVSNLTHLTIDFKARKSYPRLLVMGAGLWHMLHVNKASDYESVLRTLKGSVTQQMRDAVWHDYDAALTGSGLLRQTGGSIDLLDIPSLTWNCGAHCTYDGMHYDIVNFVRFD